MVHGQANPKAAILVLEDSVAIRTLVRAILEDAGYVVLGAGTVEEATRQLQSAADRPRALICDVNLPGENSLAGVERLCEIEPSLKVLYMSGDAIGSALPSGSAFIQKPFSPRTLVRRLEMLLVI